MSFVKSNFRKRLGLQFFAEPTTPDTIEGIEQRLSAIQSELENPEANIEALNDEVNKLISKRNQLKASAEQRSNLLNQIANITGGTPFQGLNPPQIPEQRGNQEFTVASLEYRSAWLKNLHCSQVYTPSLTEQEKRAFTTVNESAGAVVPTQVSNTIITKVKQFAPLLDKINLLRVPGNVTFAVEKDIKDAKAHTENENITPDADTLTKITLSSYEITKLVQVSKSVIMMSISAFESWLTDMIARKMAEQISKVIISGAGSTEGTGIESAATWPNDTNAVEVGSSTSLATNDVLKLISLLPGGYDARAEFLMSKKTLFVDFMPLQDKSKNNIVTTEGKDYYIYGYHVVLDERIKEHEAYLGDLYTVVGNMPEDVNITSDFSIKDNSYLFLGCAMFDCKPSVAEAFVKLKKADG